MLSEQEEMELNKIAKNLQVDLRFSENALKNLERCRYLWKLHTGEIPRVQSNLQLRKGERCAAFVNAVHYDVSNPNVPVKYSGYNELRGQSGIGFHSGMLNRDKMIGQVIRFLDQGKLHFTDHRLLFSGTNGRIYYLYHNLIGGTFYANGLLIEQKRGRDQFFKFSGDIQSLRLIFDNLMTKSRK